MGLVAFGCFVGGRVLRKSVAASQEFPRGVQISEPSPKTSAEAQDARWRPGMAQVANARGGDLLKLAAQFLNEATFEETRLLGEQLRTAGDVSSIPGLVWSLLAARLVDHDDPDGALELASSLDNQTAFGLRLTIFELWAEHDLHGAIGGLTDEDQSLLLRVCKVAAKSDMATALDLLERYPDNHSAASIILKQLAETDPRAALERARHGPDSSSIVASIIGVWMKSDPASALAWIKEESDQSSKGDGHRMRALMKAIEIDPDRAAAHIFSTYPKGQQRCGLTKSLARAMAKRDIDQALQWARTLESPVERHAAIVSVVGSLKDDPKRLFSILDDVGWHNVASITSDGRRTFRESGESGGWSGSGLIPALEMAVTKLAKDDPKQAMRRVASIPDDPNRHNSVRLDLTQAVASAWVSSNPLGFMEWVNEGVPHSAVQRLTSADIADDAIEAFSKSLSVVDSDEIREKFAHRLASRFENMAENDPLGTIELSDRLDELPADSYQRVIDAAVPALAAQDLEEALGRYDQVSKTRRDAAASAIIAAMATNDVERALLWFAEIPDADRGRSSHRAIAEAWFEHDSLAASEWVGQLPAGTGRDSSVEAIVSGLTSGRDPDYASAVAWATTLGNSGTRNQQLEKTFKSWLRHDPERAREALHETVLPEAVFNRLANSLPTR